MERYSTCCGAPMSDASYFFRDDPDTCPDCGIHCDFVTEEELKDYPGNKPRKGFPDKSKTLPEAMRQVRQGGSIGS